GLLFSLMVSRNISRPITRLANAVKEISPSNMVLTVETGSRDEVGVLENRFKTMLNNLRVTQSDLEFSTQELEKTATQLKTANDRLEFRVKERTRELEDAQAEQKRLITILESTSDIVMSVMPDATVTYINNAGRKMMGWSQNDDIRIKKISDLHPQWALNKIKNKGIPSAIAKNIWGGETAIIGADGKERPVSQVIMAHTLSNGKLDYLSTIMRDITERKQAQKELMDTKNYIDDIINSMPSVLVGVDKECRVTQCNMQAEKKTNIKTKNAKGKKLIDIFPHMATQTDRIRKAIKTCEIQFDPKQSLQRDGETIYEDVTIYPLVAGSVKGAVIRIDDVTDKVGMEEMIIQSEKMLSVGGLAAGMAHEINNPLAGIMQNTDLILRRIRNDMPANDRVAEEAGTTMEAIRSFMTKRKMVQHLEMVHYAGAQAAKIVQNMLSFSRQDKSGKSEQNLAELFNQTVDLAASDYDLKNKYDFKQIEIIREYESGIPNVPCEPSKIQQVFFNILKNGAQAMHENKKRTKKPQFILRVSKEKNMVRAEIQDNGPGMKEKNSKHIFEPFYTTKGVGAGTGLGLSISYFIIKENHGGTIEVESVPEKGTKFIIRLPLKKET
ncbi:MAG: PAS domain S-box protein, partial [Desulfobacula sp.]|nr:PAS domain S-box protein [Desulfobacula sp.]